MLVSVVACTFLAVFCTVVALFTGVSSRQDSPRHDLKRRLRQMARAPREELPDGLRAEILREIPPLDRLLSRLPLARDLERRLDQAGLRVRPTTFLALLVLATLVFLFLAWMLSGSFASALIAASLPIPVGGLYLNVMARQRSERFTELFPDALTMIARSLRAGHSFTTAIQLVGQEMPNPVGELFRVAYDQQQLGLRMTDSLINMNDRIKSLDLRFFTTVVAINSEIGGNLSETLNNLSFTIRERLRIRRQVQVYTAQGRMSGYVLGALPVVTFVVFNVLNPGYESALIREPMGRYALLLAVCMQLIGALVIKSIIKIKI